MKVEVYYNLKRSVWSIRALEGESKGKVFLYSDSLIIENARFIVRESGRQKVLRDRQKNVHAFVRGNMISGGSPTCSLPLQISYNPYKNSTFVILNSGSPILEARLVYLHDDRKVTCMI